MARWIMVVLVLSLVIQPAVARPEDPRLALTWGLIDELQEALSNAPESTQLEGDFSAQGAPDVTWTASISKLAISDDASNAFVASFSRDVGLAASGGDSGLAFSQLTPLMATYTPVLLEQLGEHVRVVELRVKSDAGELVVPHVLLGLASEQAPEVVWTPPSEHLSREDGLRASLDVHSGAMFLRALLIVQSELEADPFMGPRARKSRLALWPWSRVWMEVWTAGRFRLGTFDIPLAPGEGFDGALELLDFRPALEADAERLAIGLANADHFATLLCTHIETPESGCLDAATREGVEALALGLEGYVRFFDDPARLLEYYTLQGNEQVIPGVTAKGTVVPFRNPRELLRVMQGLQADPTTLQRFIVESDPTRRENMLGEALPSAPLELSFSERGIYGAITLENPDRYVAELEARRGEVTRKVKVYFRK